MKPLVVDFLTSHSFQQLEDEHGVCARKNEKGDKISLNYDQILIKEGDPVAEQCRGLIVRPKFNLNTDDWKSVVVGDVEILAWPMNRFYNHGDSKANDVDWSDKNLRVYEKLDGTMIVLYWDELHQRWHAGTRSVPEADLPLYNQHLLIGDMTFSDLFWRGYWNALCELGAPVPSIDSTDISAYDAVQGMLSELDKCQTYVFELTGPHNRVVVNYEKELVYLLAIRNIFTGIEIPVEKTSSRSFLYAQKWSLHEPVSLVAFIESCDPSKYEGAVVVDSNFNRIKIKNSAWVFSSRAKEMVTSSPRNAIECIILSKLDDVIPLVEKDVGEKLLDIQSRLLKYCKNIDTKFKEYQYEAGTSRKRFAEQVMLSGDWSAPYFQLWDKKAETTLQWLQGVTEGKSLPSSMADVILSKIK